MDNKNQPILETKRNERNDVIFCLLGMVLSFFSLASLAIGGNENSANYYPIFVLLFVAGGATTLVFLINLAKHHRHLAKIETEEEYYRLLFPQHAIDSHETKRANLHADIVRMKRNSSRKSKLYQTLALIIGVILSIVPLILIIGPNASWSAIEGPLYEVFLLLVFTIIVVLIADGTRKLFT